MCCSDANMVVQSDQPSFAVIDENTSSSVASSANSTSTGGGGGGPSSASGTSAPPSFGLKLVLKRQHGNKYEVKNVNSSLSLDQPCNHAAASEPSAAAACRALSSPTLSESTSHMFASVAATVAACSVSTRPKREAARKVKFIFSETEDDGSPVKCKRVRLDASNNAAPGAAAAALAVVRQASHVLQKSDSSDQNRRMGPRSHQRLQQADAVALRLKAAAAAAVATTAAAGNAFCHIVQPEALMLFQRAELISRKMSEKVAILQQQPKVVISHSRPFPIALVEDQTNVVYTKALLFLHLFKSYSSQCINCPWCRTFLTIADFSKHIHPEDLDDEEDDEDYEDDTDKDDEQSDIDSSDSESNQTTSKSGRSHRSSQYRRQRRLEKFKQKSFKILPYCSGGQNDELSAEDIKTWRLFGDRYTLFKQNRVQHETQVKQLERLVKEQEEQRQRDKMLSLYESQVNSRRVLLSLNNKQQQQQQRNASSSSSVSSSSTTGFLSNSFSSSHSMSSSLSSSAVSRSSSVMTGGTNNAAAATSSTGDLGANSAPFDNWDFVSEQRDLFMLSREKFESEKLVYLNPTPIAAATTTTTTTTNDIKRQANASASTPSFRRIEHDLSLSEEDDDDNDNNNNDDDGGGGDANANVTYATNSSIAASSATVESTDQSTQSAVDVDSLSSLSDATVAEAVVASVIKRVATSSIETQTGEYKLYYVPHKPPPTIRQRYFNMYDNLPRDFVCYILNNQFTIVPDSFVLYQNRKVALNRRRTELAGTDKFKLVWLSITLDLEMRKSNSSSSSNNNNSKSSINQRIKKR